MKKFLFCALAGLTLTGFGQNNSIAPAETQTAAVKAPAGKVDFAPELEAVTAQLKQKFDTGKTSEADLAENLQAINALIARHAKDGNREQVARLYLLDAHIYADGLKDKARARAIWTQVARDFPGTSAAQGASLSLAKLNADAAAEPDPRVPEGLEIGQKFPGFSETDIAGKPLSLAGYRGKVVLIDFWATWCPPCRAEMPNVVATYRKYHAPGFEVIGVSLDENRNTLVNFLPAHGMVWPQFFDGQGWDNKLAKKYGVHSIPTAYLLDRHGIIIGKELRGAELGEAVEKALTKN
jgi:thiol-disulfide isomerase/thioredoxin